MQILDMKKIKDRCIFISTIHAGLTYNNNNRMKIILHNLFKNYLLLLFPVKMILLSLKNFTNKLENSYLKFFEYILYHIRKKKTEARIFKK